MLLKDYSNIEINVMAVTGISIYYSSFIQYLFYITDQNYYIKWCRNNTKNTSVIGVRQ